VSLGYAPQNTTYALLLPFVDGMIEGARTGRIVDGHELAYAFKEPRQFEAAYRLMRETGDTLAADPAGYARALSFGFGIWIDYDWRNRGWSAGDPASNYFRARRAARGGARRAASQRRVRVDLLGAAALVVRLRAGQAPFGLRRRARAREAAGRGPRQTPSMSAAASNGIKISWWPVTL
jgi:hypothetical protein